MPLWLAQAARRFWRRLRAEPAVAVPPVPEDGAATPLSFPARTPAAGARPKQRRGYADKMLRAGDYADKGRA